MCYTIWSVLWGVTSVSELLKGEYKKFGKSMFEKFKERKLYVSVGLNIVTGMLKCMIVVGCLKKTYILWIFSICFYFL